MAKTVNAVAFKWFITLVSTLSLHTVGVFTCTNLNYILSYDLMSQVKQLGRMCFSLYAEMHQSVA